jgi:hypothetical protein
MVYLSFCAPERIPMILVEGAIADEAERLAAIAALTEVSLLRHDPFEDGTPAVVVHRLVQAIVRGRLDTSWNPFRLFGWWKKIKWSTKLAFRLANIYPDSAHEDISVWPPCAHLTPHVLKLQVQGKVSAQFTVNAGWAHLLNRTGVFFQGCGDYATAELLFRESPALRCRASARAALCARRQGQTEGGGSSAQDAGRAARTLQAQRRAGQSAVPLCAGLLLIRS